MSQTSQTPRHGEYKEYDDEISLIDLALVLMRRKWLIIGIFIVCAGLGLSYALLMQGEPAHRYTTIVELARMDDGKPEESIKGTQAILVKTFVPMLRDELRKTYEDPAKRPPEADISIPNESERLLQIASEGVTNDYEDITYLHSGLVEYLKEELDKVVLTQKENIELEKKNILAEIKRLAVEKERLMERIEHAQSRLETVRSFLDRAPREATDEVQAMTLLMIQSQMEEAHEQMVSLEDQFYSTIPDKLDSLNLKLANLNNKLESITTTQIRMLVRQSDNPVGGTSKKLILALSLVLGGMLGILGAFFAEFAGKIKEAAKR